MSLFFRLSASMQFVFELMNAVLVVFFVKQMGCKYVGGLEIATVMSFAARVKEFK